MQDQDLLRSLLCGKRSLYGQRKETKVSKNEEFRHLITSLLTNWQFGLGRCTQATICRVISHWDYAFFSRF